MKAISFGLMGLAFFAACAQQEDAPSTTCNVRSANCSAAGSVSTAGNGGAVSAGGGGGTVAGATSMAGSGAGSPPSAGASGTPGGAGAPSAGAPGAGAPGAGAPGAGAPGAGAGGALGAGAGGAAAAGAPAAGAPGAGAGGAPAAGSVVIESNRSDGTGARFFLKVVPPNNYLQWTGTSAADAEVFEEVIVGTDQVKLLATSVNKYVALDQTVPMGKTDQGDYLIANQATAAGAAVLNIALCAATNAKAAKCAPNCRGIQVMTDDDANNFVVSDDQFTLTTGSRARSDACGASATAWESWEFIPH